MTENLNDRCSFETISLTSSKNSNSNSNSNSNLFDADISDSDSDSNNTDNKINSEINKCKCIIPYLYLLKKNKLLKK